MGKFLQKATEAHEKKGIMTLQFKEEPLSVSFHPFGLFLAVGFQSGFRIYAILNQQLSLLKEINLQSSRIVKYAHGGHFLVASDKRQIIIFDSVNYEEIQMLEGPQGDIIDLQIAHDDIHLVSTCTHG